MSCDAKRRPAHIPIQIAPHTSRGRCRLAVLGLPLAGVLPESVVFAARLVGGLRGLAKGALIRQIVGRGGFQTFARMEARTRLKETKDAINRARSTNSLRAKGFQPFVSFDALAWAAKCNPGSAGRKLVLLALAECASRENNLAFPSIGAIAEFSCLNRKTIIAALDDLEATGFIAATGEKVGRTRQVKVYHLNTGTVPKAEQFQKRNSTDFSGKQYRKRDTEPVKEPVSKKENRAHELPDDWEPRELAAGTKSAGIASSWSEDERAAIIEHFLAHHRKKGDKFKDWQQAWVTWVLNSVKFRSNGNGGHIRTGNGQGPDKRSGLARALDGDLERIRELRETPAIMGGHDAQEGW